MQSASKYLSDHQCDFPGIVENGAASSTSYDYGSKITYTCDTGYRLVGDRERMCMDDGKWTGSSPTCQGMISFICLALVVLLVCSQRRCRVACLTIEHHEKYFSVSN